MFKPEQLWKTHTTSGQTRYWYWSHNAQRAIPYPAADAELLIATEAAALTEKPSWVGHK